MKQHLTTEECSVLQHLLALASHLVHAQDVVQQILADALGIEEAGPWEDVLTDAMQSGWTVDRLCRELGIVIDEA